MLEQVTRDPSLRIAQVEVLDSADRHQILRDWNATARTAPERTLPGLFEAQARRSPDSIAVACGDTEISYATLNAQPTGSPTS